MLHLSLLHTMGGSSISRKTNKNAILCTKVNGKILSSSKAQPSPYLWLILPDLNDASISWWSLNFGLLSIRIMDSYLSIILSLLCGCKWHHCLCLYISREKKKKATILEWVLLWAVNSVVKEQNKMQIFSFKTEWLLLSHMSIPKGFADEIEFPTG